MVYKGDLIEVYLSKGFANEKEMKERKQNDEKRGVKGDYLDNYSNEFNGTQFEYQDTATEILTWKYI